MIRRSVVDIAGTPNPRILPVCTLHEGVVGRCSLCQDATKRVACQWTLDGDNDENNPEGPSWRSACGERWLFNDGGPVENRVRFCHGCGKPVQA